MARGFPARVHLPSGAVLTLHRATSPRAAPATLRGAVTALGGAVLDLVDEKGEPVDVEAVSLQDFHAIRAIATALELLPEDTIDVPCDNCPATLSVRPSGELELAPFLDGELHDEELDEAFAFGDSHPIPSLFVGRSEARFVRLREVTVGEAIPLFDALEREPLRITSAVVRALGIAALGAETSAPRIARALSRASDEAWGAVADTFVAAAYTPRLTAWALCPSCGARTPVEAPFLREFPEDHASRRAAALADGFPDLEAFETIVREKADEIYTRLGVARVDLILEDGVAAVDDGGVPLLGSYEPGMLEAPGFPAQPPEVRVYYRTFRAMWADEGEYDVEAEIAETIEHELEHHLAFLRGEDPEDERERAHIAREARSRVGETETLRQASRQTRAALTDFVRRTWPLWVLLLAGMTAMIWSSR